MPRFEVRVSLISDDHHGRRQVSSFLARLDPHPLSVGANEVSFMIRNLLEEIGVNCETSRDNLTDAGVFRRTQEFLDMMTQEGITVDQAAVERIKRNLAVALSQSETQVKRVSRYERDPVI